MAPTDEPRRARGRLLLVAAAVLGVLAVGGLDYATGIELRLHALYFLPLSLGAWHARRAGTGALVVLCTAVWAMSNYAAGMTFSTGAVWAVNLCVQCAGFGTVGFLVSELRSLIERERAHSRTDPLTSIPNSRAFYERAAVELARARRTGRPLTAAYLDLDDFKSINDEHGHLAGDRVLQSVATALRDAARSTDVFARLGGDEFALLLPESTPEEARTALLRIRGTLSRGVPGAVGPVTTSIGAVTFLHPPATVEEMVSRADAAMYEVKTSGKDRIGHHVVEAPEVAAQEASAPLRGPGA